MSASPLDVDEVLYLGHDDGLFDLTPELQGSAESGRGLLGVTEDGEDGGGGGGPAKESSINCSDSVA